MKISTPFGALLFGAWSLGCGQLALFLWSEMSDHWHPEILANGHPIVAALAAGAAVGYFMFALRRGRTLQTQTRREDLRRAGLIGLIAGAIPCLMVWGGGLILIVGQQGFGLGSIFLMAVRGIDGLMAGGAMFAVVFPPVFFALRATGQNAPSK